MQKTQDFIDVKWIVIIAQMWVLSPIYTYNRSITKAHETNNKLSMS